MICQNCKRSRPTVDGLCQDCESEITSRIVFVFIAISVLAVIVLVFLRTF